MTERLPARIAHTIVHPFVETGRRVHQVAQDTLSGGREKRIFIHRRSDIKDSRLRDGVRAVAPLTIFLSTLGLSTTLVVELIKELSSGQYQIAKNIQELVVLTVGGGILGAIGSAEHSRRRGKKWREEIEEDYL